MKSFLTTFRTLALSFALTASAAAQEATRRDAANEPAANPAPPAANAAQPVTDDMRLPKQPAQTPPGAQSSGGSTLAEAKKRYQATQKRLQMLVKSGGRRSSFDSFADDFGQMRGTPRPEKSPRDNLRAAVAEDFDARRQLQQAELAELEARVARIKRALEIRDAMRDTFIDQRTDELLEQMEDGGKDDHRGASAKRGGGHPRHPDATNSAAPPRVRDTDLKPEALHREVANAKASFDLAKRTHERALKLFKSGAISKDVLGQFQGDLERAKDWLDRSRLSWDVFREAYPDLSETEEPAADEGAPGGHGPAMPDAKDRAANPSAKKDTDAIERESRLLELDADEAIDNFESAERAYRRLEKLRASGAIEQAVLDEQIEKRALARIQLERAAVKVALDVEEAEANLESAERALKRSQKLQASGAIEQSVLDQQADQYNRAKIQLDRAESKINAFKHAEERIKALDRSPADDGAFNKPKKVSFAQPPIDESQIIWSPEDSGLLPVRQGEKTTLTISILLA